ncbi:MAG TPA: BamA/TamA family outer membrane protein, partial [Candidatus Krumholzibacteria bacterium]|nr:BamA/TamA family outer membrane protein [Candidatus Krumholzibacteria bacterium]
SHEGQALYNRTFHRDETDEVRLYMNGGNDSLVTAGPRGDITVRVIGGDGDDVFDDRAGTHLRVSDASGNNEVLRGKGTSLDTKPYTAPVRPRAPWIPPRDWGRRTYMYPVIGGNTDLGVLFMGVLQSTGYGFRKNPSADEHTARVAYATTAGSFGADYTGKFRFENSPMSMGLYVRLSGLDFLHFYGFGNESSSSESDDFYKVKHTEYVFAPSLQWEHKHTTVSLRVGTKYNKTDLEADRLITEVQPYGTGDFTQVGAGAGIAIDTRDSDSVSEGGVRVQADANVYPPIASVEDSFGEVHGEAALYQPVPLLKTPMLALRAGGKHVWGDVPYHEAAYIGGTNTLRGFARQRFAGDASVYGSAELRIPVTRLYILVPGQLGVFALGDAGRVFLDGESSDKWHTAVGGGLWFAAVDPGSSLSLAIANCEEGTGVYVHLGLSF